MKNSWGTCRCRNGPFVLPGYHDLYMAYLDGPVKHCKQNATDTGSTGDCYDNLAPERFRSVPQGY